MRYHLSGASLLLLTVLCACATAPAAPPRSELKTTLPPRTAPLSAESEAPDLAPLGEYAIPRGHCGMILYTLLGDTPVPVFRSLDDGTGIVNAEGSLTGLTLVGRSGESRVGVPSSQFFAATLGDGSSLQVSAQTEWGTSFPGGAYVKEGTLTLKGSDGWSRVLPVAGVVGCRVPT